MTLFPLMECCELLAIDPKTLRHWLEQATMSVHVHPTDRRRKCLTHEQVQQLAILHDCRLSPDETRPTPSLVKILLPQEQSQPEVVHPLTLETLLPIPSSEPGNLMQKLSCLEAKVTTLQELLAHLALELVQERRLRTEASSHIQGREQEGMHSAFQMMEKEAKSDGLRRQGRVLHPAEIQARESVLPLIEYGASGTYVIICPQEGERFFLPDTPEWFDWLARLSSFRFVGKQGHFTAYRKGTLKKPSRTWSAERYFHQHNYRHYLGVTDHLTIALLEQAATQLQSSLE